MGIIDFQQTWTMKKALERMAKIIFRGADPDGLSAIQPDLYRERFLQKMEDILDWEAPGSGVEGEQSATPHPTGRPSIVV